jgi:hypothetical protein
MPRNRRSVKKKLSRESIEKIRKSRLRRSQKQRMSSARKLSVSQRRFRQVKHIMIRGHGSFPPTKVKFHSKDKEKSYFGHTNAGDIALLENGIQLDQKLTNKSLLVTGSVPGSEGVVLFDPDISVTFLKKIKSSISRDKTKNISDICKDLNTHKNWSSRSDTDIRWAQYADSQPVEFHHSRDNVTVYYQDNNAGFYTGVYDIDDCDIDLTGKSFSDVENSKCNISESVFNELSKDNPYFNYTVEKINDPNGVKRKNYYMKTSHSDPAVLKREGSDNLRALTVPLKYLERAIRKLYKNPHMEIIFYSTICKSTQHDKSIQSYVDKTPVKSRRDKDLSVDVLSSLVDSINLDRGAKKKNKKKRKKKRKTHKK